MEELDLLEVPKLDSTYKAIETLVGDCPRLTAHLEKYTRDDEYIFCTVSPNPSTKHQVTKTVRNKRVTVQMPYGQLPQRVQYEYCLRVVTRCYAEFLSEDSIIFGTWELNEKANVHFHFIIHDPKIKNSTHLSIFRRDIANCTMVMANTVKSRQDFMNNIVFVNDSVQKRIKYMDKCYKLNKDIFPNYYKVPCGVK